MIKIVKQTARKKGLYLIIKQSLTGATCIERTHDLVKPESYFVGHGAMGYVMTLFLKECNKQNLFTGK